MHPRCRLTIDGTPVSEAFWSRLISVSITDKEGTRSDTIDMQLEAGPPFLAIPRKKAIIKAWLGYDEMGLEYFGAYTADDVTLECFPYTMQIQGKSADMRDKLKEHRERHWDDTTFGDVVKEIAGENGLLAQVAPRIAQFRGRDGYFAQEGESGLHFIERQARRLNGLFTIKDGKLIVAEKGTGQTPGGAALGTLAVTPPMIIEGSCSVKFGERESHKTVRASWHDQAKAKHTFEDVPADPEGTAVFTIRHRFANRTEAREAAEAKAKELKRAADSTSVTIEGDVRARGGAPMVYAGGVHPEVDGLPWIIETATHTLSKSAGYRTQIDAKAQTGGDTASSE